MHSQQNIKILKFILGIKLYMFRAVPLSIIRSSSLYTQQCCMSYRFADSLRAGSGRKFRPDPVCKLPAKPVRHIPLLCVQWRTPDDVLRKCPKHVEFYSKNKFEKLVQFVIRIYHDARSPERQISLKRCTCLILLMHDSMKEYGLPAFPISVFMLRINATNPSRDAVPYGARIAYYLSRVWEWHSDFPRNFVSSSYWHLKTVWDFAFQDILRFTGQSANLFGPCRTWVV